MDLEISLNNLSFYAFHGVMEEERRIGNEFRVDLSVYIPVNEGIKEDRLSSTISYVDLFEIIDEEMKIPTSLLETLAWNIAERIKKKFETVKKGRIRIEKVRPPIPGMLGSASVSLNF